MPSIAKQSDTLPHVSKDLVEFLRGKVQALDYAFGKSIKPEDVAYIYGQQAMYEVVRSLYNRSNNDGRTIFNTKDVHPSGGKPRGDQEESLFGPTKE